MVQIKTLKNKICLNINFPAKKFSLLKLTSSTSDDQNTPKKSRLACISLTWGIVADVDKESEVLRYLGDFRFDVYGFIRTLFLRRYYAKITVTSTNDETKTQSFEKNIILFMATCITHLTSDVCVNVDNQFSNPHSLNLHLVEGNISKLQAVKYMLDFGQVQVKKPAYVLENCRKITLEILPDPGKNGRTKTGHLMVDGEEIVGSVIELEMTDKKMNVI